MPPEKNEEFIFPLSPDLKYLVNESVCSVRVKIKRITDQLHKMRV